MVLQRCIDEARENKVCSELQRVGAKEQGGEREVNTRKQVRV